LYRNQQDSKENRWLGAVLFAAGLPPALVAVTSLPQISQRNTSPSLAIVKTSFDFNLLIIIRKKENISLLSAVI